MRLCEKWLYKSRKGTKIRKKIYTNLMRIVFSCDIPSTVKCGKELMLPHNGLGVVVHDKATIGNNVTIYQNVTLGGNGKIIDGKITNTGGPTIEDNCAIFCGACVLGPITIGHDSYIGANAVVTKNVPPNSVVVGNGIIKEKKHEYNLGRNNNV